MTAHQKILDSLKEGTFIRLSLSPPATTVRKIENNKGALYQLTQREGAQAFHKNLNEKELKEWLEASSFKQGQLFCTDADYHLFFPGKVIKNRPTASGKTLSHNRAKNYLLSQENPPPYFQKLGIKKDKFVQIEKFLHEVKASLPALEGLEELHAVDFGCGKAYLTFALYDFLKDRFKLTLVGIDLKKKVMEDCQALADSLGYTGLKFIQGHIDELPWKKADLVVALHACDTATDAALEKGVSLGAKVILAAPCCQHELYHQIKSETLTPLLKHGLLRERFASLVTDAARAELLEQRGYEVKLVEFIDAAHTPKNLLIRALYTGHKRSSQPYEIFKESLKILPDLEKRLAESPPNLEKLSYLQTKK